MPNLISLDSVAQTPWKNGGGTTRELWRRDGADGVFDIRVSVARVERDGPFSDYAGYDRTLLLLEGSAFSLRVGGAVAVHLPRLHAVSFAGEASVLGELPEGPVEDFNVMTRRKAYRHSVRVVAAGDGSPPVRMDGVLGVLLCVRGAFGLKDGARVTPGQVLIMENEQGRAEPAGADAVGVLAQFTRA
jgi:environmental stress-induced protein Ves